MRQAWTRQAEKRCEYQKKWWQNVRLIFIRIKKFIKKTSENAYVFSVIAKIVSVATGLLYSILYSRYMKPELRGIGSVIINYAEIIMLVSCLGVYQGYPYFKKRQGKIFMRSL